MEYKYSTINEVNHFEFGEAVVGDIQLTERMFHLVLDNVKICPENSCWKSGAASRSISAIRAPSSGVPPCAHMML